MPDNPWGRALVTALGVFVGCMWFLTFIIVVSLGGRWSPHDAERVCGDAGVQQIVSTLWDVSESGHNAVVVCRDGRVKGIGG